MQAIRKWWKPALVIVLLLVGAQAGMSLLVRTHRMHAYLIAHLERAFGRPVEVGQFAVQILPAPRLDADGFTVGEDPAFGNEYFLRAEHLSAGLRWSGLLRGHFEFGTLSLSRPSLILVRNSEGPWNLERWLPPAKEATLSHSRIYGPPSVIAPVNRLQKIEFDDGRINFKNGTEKLAFAFVGVSGSVDQVLPGRWQLRLEAQPWRSGVTLQSAGTLRVQGDVAGTSSRLQPAEISVHWTKASLADVFRLLRGQDYGVRGTFALDAGLKSGASGVPVQLQPGAWTFSLQAQAGEIHRWDLTERQDNPRLNFKADGRWYLAAGIVGPGELAIEAPHSNMRGSFVFGSGPHQGFELHLDSAGIQATDLLAWYRAFHPDVMEGVRAEQYFTGAMTLRGWPLELEEAAFSSEGGTVKVPGLPDPLSVGKVQGGRARSKLEVEPVRISFAEERRSEALASKSSGPASRKRTAAELRNGVEIGFTHDLETHAGALTINGRVDKAEDALKVASAFGRALNRGWELTGSANAALHWDWTGSPLHGLWNGQIELSKAKLQVAGLNQPLQMDAAKMEWHEGERVAEIGKAEGFGSTWSGEISESNDEDEQGRAQWRFNLQADHLDATELDRWVGPRARPNWLQRLLSSVLGGSAPTPPASELVRRVNAQGELRIGELKVEKLKLEQVRLQGALHDLKLDVPQAEARWAGGAVRAELHAAFTPRPSYDVTARLEGVNLAELPGAGRAGQRLAGLASGALRLKTEGVGRDQLLLKLAGGGNVRLKNVEFRGWDVNASVADGTPHSGTSRWASGEGEFSLRNRTVFIDVLTLQSGKEQTSVLGTVGFGREADLTLQSASIGRTESPAHEPSVSGRVLKISGPLDGPRVIVVRQPAD